MFRQRLKGGHRVGTNLKVSSASQHVDLNSPSLPQVSNQDWYPQHSYSNIEGSWNVNPTSDISKPGYQHHSQNTQSQLTENFQHSSQMQNGSNLQNQGQDAWNWGSDDNWNDWGNGDSFYVDANHKNNNPPTTSYKDQPFTLKDESGEISAQSAAQISYSVETNNSVPLCYCEETSSLKVENLSDHPSTLKKDDNFQINNTVLHDNLKENAVSCDIIATGAVYNNPKEEISNFSQTVGDSNEYSQFSRIQSFFASGEKDSNVSGPEIHSSLNTEATSTAVYSSSTSLVENVSSSQEDSQHNYSCSPEDNERKLKYENNSDNWEETEFNNTLANKNNENRSNLDMMQGQAINNECFENLEANNITKCSENEQIINQFPQDLSYHCLENFDPNSTEEGSSNGQPNNQLPQDLYSHTNDTSTSNEASAPPVSSWDDEWGDGWETKPLSCQGSESSLEQSETNPEISTSFPVVENLNQSNMEGSGSNDAFEFTVKDSVKDNYEKDWELSTNQIPELSNIQALDQELQGIFSGPTEAAAVVNEVNEDHLPANFSFKEKLDVINFDDSIISDIPNKGKENAAVDSGKIDNLSIESIEVNDEGASNGNIQKTVAFPSEASQQVTTNYCCTSSLLLNNFESEEKTTNTKDQAAPIEKLEDNNFTSKVTKTAPGPSGNMLNLQARKGSPFQPPTYKRSTVVQSHNADTKVLSSHPFNFQSIINPIPPLQENTILLNSHPPESNVRLQVVQNSFQNRKIGELELNKTLVTSERDKITNSACFDQILPAHLSSMQNKLEQPKVRTLETMNDTPTSPSVLDLSQLSIKKERDNESPAFKRMVPGESTKGESAPALGYQIPIIVPAMPSGRVVTGNDNPQPIPFVRVKQEHNEIRAPPDGPDTGVLPDESPGVIPPIRSETIGSEGHSVRPLINNRRDDDDSDSQRERGKDGKRDYYIDRHNERKRNESSFYPHDSPQRSNKQRDIDYDPFYGERHYYRRPLHDDDYDDEEEDGDERKYLHNMSERRKRAYRDELERYGGRERQYGREKRRNRNRDRDGQYLLEDEDFYEAPSSDRSRPSSRSSSFGNADSETGAGCHISHLDEFYDPRYPKHRDKPREKGYRNSYRDYPPYKKREDKEKDPYGKGFYPYGDRYGQREMYDPHSYYYYYQQSYQKYLEQHPYYREYYRQYYGRYGYPGGDPSVDDKTSTRSGRSSVNDEIKKASLSSQFHQDFVGQSSVSVYEPSLYPDHYSFTCKSYISGDGSRVPSITDEAPVEPKQRTSPQLYTGPHLKASFTSGGKLLLVLPNDPKEGEKATVQLRNVQKMLAVDNEYDARIKKLASYPGPLTLNDTHKDVVLRFCEEKSLQALENETVFDRESVVLIWDYLSLLVKQNGKVSGADLAGLLIRGRGRLPDLSSTGSLNEKRTNIVEGVGSDNSDTSNKILPDHSELLKKFSELLCLGRKKEAVEYAIKEELWGYAMVLAAKMDSMTHARVIAAFMQSIPSNDVLHTLIQHLSGKKPEVARNYCSEKWGDWRLHLAMMVSNPTGNLQKDMSSIIALGDSLVAKQRYHAAHICYLAADAGWGCYSDKDSKLVLIGSSPHQPFQLFSSDDAIQCTEIFEFAKCLDSNSPILLGFQSYKLIYGYRLAEFGFPNEALKYCQVITEAVVKQPTAFHLDFIAKVFELASQLKYHDVYYQMGEGELSEMDDPDWLQSLNQIFQNLQYQANEKYLKTLESDPVVLNSDISADPDGENRFSTCRGSEVNRGHSQASNNSNHLPPDPAEQEIYTETTQVSDIQEIETSSASHSTVQKGKHFPNEDYPYQRIHSVTSVGTTLLNSLSCVETVSSPQNDYYQQQQQYHQYQQKTQECSSLPVQQKQISLQQIQQSMPQQQETVDHSGSESEIQNPISQSEQTFSHEISHSIPEHNGRESSLQHVPLENAVTSSEMSAEELQYWKLMTGKGNESFKKAEDLVDSSSKQENTNQIEHEAQEQQQKLQKQLADGYDEKDDDKKSSFLGSLFGGWRKNTNQAKLPDDKNPSIVWDEDKKKWVNKDGDTTDEQAPPPPPSAIMGQPPPILRGGPKKSRYVDPVGEKGRTRITNSALSAPISNLGAIPPPKSIRVNEQPILTSWEPQQYPEISDVPSTSSSIQTQEPPDTIHRQRFASSSSSVDLYDDSDLNQRADQGNSIPMMNPVESQPQPLFFNPAQFQAQQPAQANPPRRAGPAKRSYNPQR